MKIVSGYSDIVRDKYTIYNVIHKGIVYTVEIDITHWNEKIGGFYLNGKWALLNRYHKDSSSDKISVTPEQILTKKFPDDGYTGKMLAYLTNDVLSEELQNEFIREFKSYERDRKIETILE